MTERDLLGRILHGSRDATVEFIRRWNRLEISGNLSTPTEPVLFVGNHGFGGIFDLNGVAAWAALQKMQLDRPVTILVHEVTWTLGLGAGAERIGGQKASADAVRQAFADGHHILVFPGGDLDAFKSHRNKDRIVFGGRSGFARLAMECGVPIVPIVTAGAGDSLYVISDGQGLARALGVDKSLRLKALPISLSAPWGLSIGLVGFLPYLPLPAKLRTRVLSPLVPADGESAEGFATRVETAMQNALSTLVGQKKAIR